MKPQPEDCSAVHRFYKSAYWKDKPMSLVVNEDGSVYCKLCGYGAKLEGGSIFRLPYKVGEIVAVAQSYNSFYNDECNPNLFPNDVQQNSPPVVVSLSASSVSFYLQVRLG